MLTATIIFYSVIVSYVIIIVYEAIETRNHSPKEPRKAPWTLVLFFLIDALVIVGGVIEYQYVEEIDTKISIVGLFLIAAKILIKRMSMRTLGEFYNAHIVVGESHRVVKSGIYKYVRHPAYLAHFLSIVGIPLMLNAFCILLVAAVVDLAFLSIRIRREEKELIVRFGKEYLEYRCQVWTIIPFRNLFR